MEFARCSWLGNDELQLPKLLHPTTPGVHGPLAEESRFSSKSAGVLDRDDRMIGHTCPEAKQHVAGRLSLRLGVDDLHGNGQGPRNRAEAVVSFARPFPRFGSLGEVN
ncbi:hypothetical protein D9M68_603190 [compost metagenome]